MRMISSTESEPYINAKPRKPKVNRNDSLERLVQNDPALKRDIIRNIMQAPRG